ncbi:MAG: TrkH family potassium uptake protein [Desulfobulbaceae bacterium]|jgi:trk system potassium uptake protein TrkH|nr:TrkH family potassium uptake protein [Desulfobulbaceae bacterium]MDY0351044.1 TrkH family potassium uptake protein [Desulfobulbaceae bacterium]
MRIGGVLNLLGKLLLILSMMLLTPLPFSLYFHDGMVTTFALCSGIGLITGGLLAALFLPEEELGYKDGFAIVTFSWLSLGLLGALPYYLSGHIPGFVDAFFESVSGFTTTGSTILADIEALPRSLLFWRAMTQWLGGMGIIVLTLAVLPLLGIGGMQLFQAEVPGPTKDRLAPRVQDTARILWSVYLVMTAVQTVLLMLGGIDFFNALTHSFTTLATGGFSNFNASIAHYPSPYIQSVFILFMFLAGVSFSLHFLVLRQQNPLSYWRNEEFRFYLSLILLAVLLVFVANTAADSSDHPGRGLLEAAFQVVSLMTTTGYGTADFDAWPSFSRVLLVSLMFVGGCAGSTGGGIKVVRFLLFFKYARSQLHKLVHPRQVETIKLGRTKVPQEVMIAILSFFAIYLAVFVIASLIITAMGADIITGPSAVIATLNNIGPGLALVGPTQHFGHLPDPAKLVLIFCMLAGRLELYTVAILLTPGYWSMTRRPKLRWTKTRIPTNHE